MCVCVCVCVCECMYIHISVLFAINLTLVVNQYVYTYIYPVCNQLNSSCRPVSKDFNALVIFIYVWRFGSLSKAHCFYVTASV